MAARTLRSKRLPSPSRSSATSQRNSTLAKRSTKPAEASTTGAPRYFLIVASRDHVLKGVEGGFCQANHGKKAPLMQMKKGDGVLFYSARETYTPKSKGKADGKMCQKITAMGRVKDDDVFQVKVFEGFEPYRRNVEFLEGKEVSILPLIERLGFIRDKTHWGASLRFGFLKIAEGDWDIIEKEMMRKEE